MEYNSNTLYIEYNTTECKNMKVSKPQSYMHVNGRVFLFGVRVGGFDEHTPFLVYEWRQAIYTNFG
jgi:hypothetical protein